jgi:ABC-2 type transport system permease protein
MPTTNRARTTSRLATAVRVSLASSPTFANSRTVLSMLVAVPILQLALLLAISTVMGSADTRTTAYAGVLVTAGISIIGGMIESVSTDRQLGVLQQALSRKWLNAAYWAGKAVVPAVVAGTVAILLCVGVFALDPEHNPILLCAALLVLPIVVVVGILTGVATATISIGLRDPYLVSNLLMLAVPITAGVMAPLSAYPAWLATIAQGVPLTATVAVFRELAAAEVLPEFCLAGWTLWPLGSEAVVVGLWLLLGLSLSRVMLWLIRTGRRSEDIW